MISSHIQLFLAFSYMTGRLYQISPIITRFHDLFTHSLHLNQISLIFTRFHDFFTHSLRHFSPAPPQTPQSTNILIRFNLFTFSTTITAARIYYGQKLGRNGEESTLSFEKFPHIGLSKVTNMCSQCVNFTLHLFQLNVMTLK